MKNKTGPVHGRKTTIGNTRPSPPLLSFLCLLLFPWVYCPLWSFSSFFSAKKGQRGQSLITKLKPCTQTTPCLEVVGTQRVRRPLRRPRQRRGTQLTGCVLRLIDLPAMSSCAAVTRQRTNLPLWNKTWISHPDGPHWVSPSMARRASKSDPVWLIPSLIVHVDCSSCGESLTSVALWFPRSTCATSVRGNDPSEGPCIWQETNQ